MRTEFLDERAEPGFRHAVITPHFERFRMRVLLPDGWQVADLPAEEPDFSQPALFAPLAVCVAQFAMLVFTVAARPKFENGTVFEWAAFLLSTQGIQPESVMPARVGPFHAVEAIATQATDAGPVRTRLYFFEDGGTLYHVSAMASAALQASVDPVFDRMLASFDLEARSGPTAPLHPEQPIPDPEEEPAAGSGAQPSAGPQAAAEPGESTPPAEPGAETTFAALALAADPGTLDPEHPVNANLRNAGAGLVPNVTERDDAARRATVAAGSILAHFGVPYGWHVIDDGRRTLVFDSGNRIQVNLALVDPDGGTDDDVLAAVLREYREAHPDVQHLELVLGGRKCLAFRGVRDGDTLLEQAFLVEPARDGLLLKTRVTALPADMSRAMDLAGLILESLRHAG